GGKAAWAVLQAPPHATPVSYGPMSIQELRYFTLELGYDPASQRTYTVLGEWYAAEGADHTTRVTLGWGPPPHPQAFGAAVPGQPAEALPPAAGGRIRLAPSSIASDYWLEICDAMEATSAFMKTSGPGEAAGLLTKHVILLLPQLPAAIESLGKRQADPEA